MHFPSMSTMTPPFRLISHITSISIEMSRSEIFTIFGLLQRWRIRLHFQSPPESVSGKLSASSFEWCWRSVSSFSWSLRLCLQTCKISSLILRRLAEHTPIQSLPTIGSNWQSPTHTYGCSCFTSIFICGWTFSPSCWGLAIAAFIAIGGTLQKFRRTGVFGIYLSITGLWDTCTFHAWGTTLARLPQLLRCSSFRQSW